MWFWATGDAQLYSENPGESLLVRCDACGRPNAETATYCSGCLGRLE